MRASNIPCAACRVKRQKCTEECVFKPHFPVDNLRRFLCVHQVFGASNVGKLLNELDASHRAEMVESLVFEAEARLRDPAYGCVGYIWLQQQRLKQIQSEIHKVKKELYAYLSPEVVQAALFANHNEVEAKLANLGIISSIGKDLPHQSNVGFPPDGNTNVVATAHDKLMMRDGEQQELLEAQQLAARQQLEQELMQKIYEQQQLQEFLNFGEFEPVLATVPHNQLVIRDAQQQGLMEAQQFGVVQQQQELLEAQQLANAQQQQQEELLEAQHLAAAQQQRELMQKNHEQQQLQEFLKFGEFESVMAVTPYNQLVIQDPQEQELLKAHQLSAMEQQHELLEAQQLASMQQQHEELLQAERLAAVHQQQQEELSEAQELASVQHQQHELLEAQQLAAMHQQQELLEAQELVVVQQQLLKAQQSAAAQQQQQELLEAQQWAAMHQHQQELLEAQQLAAMQLQQELLEAQQLASVQQQQEFFEAQKLAAMQQQQELLETRQLDAMQQQQQQQQLSEAQQLVVVQHQQQELLEAQQLVAMQQQQELLEAQQLVAMQHQQELSKAQQLATVQHQGLLDAQQFAVQQELMLKSYEQQQQRQYFLRFGELEPVLVSGGLNQMGGGGLARLALGNFDNVGSYQIQEQQQPQSQGEQHHHHHHAHVLHSQSHPLKVQQMLLPQQTQSQQHQLPQQQPQLEGGGHWSPSPYS